MNEFDYIIWEAREIFDFYGMNREKPVIDEILYNSDYVLRHLLGDNQIFDENLKKEVHVLDIIQQVFNNVNQHYSLMLLEIKPDMMISNLIVLKPLWIRCFMLFLQNLLTRTPLRKIKIKMTTLRSFALCLVRGVKR